ncbi:MAG TPA: sulfotransferase, partial [Devosiaceae bacterium]|nr:sulfotransferase [Devosiaceae bacterium]
AELGSQDEDPQAVARSLRNMTRAQSREMALRCFGKLQRLGGRRARVTDKLPHNFERLGLANLLMPRARVIHCRREPVATCVSCFTHSFNEFHGYNTDLDTMGRYYREYRRIMAHWRAVLPIRMLESDYEELVNDQEACSRALIDFLGLQWEDACLTFYESDRLVQTLSRWQVRQPIYRTSVEGWRKYEKHLGPLFEGLGDLAPVRAPEVQAEPSTGSRG